MDGEGELLRSNPPAPSANFRLDLQNLESFSSQGVSPVPTASPAPTEENFHLGPALPWVPQSLPSSQISCSQETLDSPISRQPSHLSHEIDGDATNAEEGALQYEPPAPEAGIHGHPRERRLSRLAVRPELFIPEVVSES